MHAFEPAPVDADHRRRHDDRRGRGRGRTEGRRRAPVPAPRPRDLARRHPAARRRARVEGPADRSPLTFLIASWTTASRASNRPSATWKQAVGRIERRLAAIERSVAAPAASGPSSDLRPSDLPPYRALPAPPDLSVPPAAVSGGDDLVTVLSFVGRTFVALGGAYLLRALTDAAIVPLPQGIALGLAYALDWLVMSDRAAAAGRPTSAAFHGLVASIIAFPLIWESVTRFQLLTPNAAAIALTLVTALMLAAALRQRSQALAWIAVVGALVTSLALVAATRVVLPFAGRHDRAGRGDALDRVQRRLGAAAVARGAGRRPDGARARRCASSSGSWPDPPARGHRGAAAAADRLSRQRRRAHARPRPRRERVRRSADGGGARGRIRRRGLRRAGHRLRRGGARGDQPARSASAVTAWRSPSSRASRGCAATSTSTRRSG